MSVMETLSAEQALYYKAAACIPQHPQESGTPCSAAARPHRSHSRLTSTKMSVDQHLSE